MPVRAGGGVGPEVDERVSIRALRPRCMIGTRTCNDQNLEEYSAYRTVLLNLFRQVGRGYSKSPLHLQRQPTARRPSAVVLTTSAICPFGSR